jgi:hypothetical protein
MTGKLLWFGSLEGRRMMSVEPIGLEFAALEGTDLAISSPFVLEVLRDDGLRLKATVHVVNGGLVCRELQLSTEHGQITGAVLNKLGLAAILQQAASHIARRLGEPTTDERFSEESRPDAGVLASDYQRKSKRIPLRRPSG